MKTLIISLFVLLLPLNRSIKAQEVENSAGNPGVYLYFINGYAAAYKFKSSGNSSYRLNADITINENDSNSDGQNYYTDDSKATTNTRTEEGTRRSFGINLSPQYLYTCYKSGAAKLYGGGGPFLGYSYFKNVSNNTEISSNPENSNNHSLFTSNAYSTGIKLLIGMESAISNSLSVFAETQLSAGHNWSENSSESFYKGSFLSSNYSTSSSKSWFYELTNVKIGIGIYF